MKERIKSIILLILVLNSLLLSGLLIFYKPSNTIASISEYIPRFKFGQDTTLKQMINPKEFVIHNRENNHYIINSANTGHEALVTEMEQWSFYNFSQINEKIDWTDLIENKQGIEIIFPVALPNSLLQSMFKVVSSTEQVDSINRIWIYDEQDGNVWAYFISDENDRIYKAQTSISSQKLVQYTYIATEQPKFNYHWSYPLGNNKLIDQVYYLPSQGLDVEIQRKIMTPVSINDFIQLLFIDPSLVKRIEMENENNILFTDGNRSMQYFSDEQYISFFQPVSDNNEEIDLNKDAYAAIRYVNQHGGWDGDYLLDEIEQTSGSSFLKFRKYINGYPLLNYEGNYGLIKLKTTDGIVSAFDRSIILLENVTQDIRYEKTYSDNELIELLAAKNLVEEDIASIELNYNIKKAFEYVVIEPYWIVYLIDGEIIKIPAYGSVVE